MLSDILFFVAGFIFLLKGADVITDAGSDIAKRLGVSNFIIGVVIVGIGTSIPEMIITLFSVLEGDAPIGIGTIVGSNTFNILFILGLAALVTPLILTKQQAWHHLPLNIFAVAIVGIMVRFGARLESGAIGLSRVEGFVLLALFFAWIFYLYYLYLISEEKVDVPAGAQMQSNVLHSHFSPPLWIILGLIGIVVGGEWVTNGAVGIATSLGVNKAVIGITVVGIGTSLPELSASLVAAYKKNYGIAVGNIIGSNIFDFLMIFGLVAAMRGLQFTEFLVLDMWVTAFASVVLFVSVFIGQKYVIKRWQGAVFVLFYLIYTAYILFIRP